MDFKDLLHRQQSNVALLIGNGINRYGATADGGSWDALLRALAQKLMDPVQVRGFDDIYGEQTWTLPEA